MSALSINTLSVSVRIHVGDALTELAKLPAESVHCCVTSPPYWGLRQYKGDPGMIGLEPTFDAHLENLVAVFREVRRVLRKDGTVWLNYGDAYAGSPPRVPYGDQGDNSIVENDRWVKPGKPKDLMMMPARVAMALQKPFLQCRGCGNVAHETRWGRFPNGRRICPGCVKSKGADVETPGWWLRSEIIWAKPNPMPESVRDRPTSSHEKMYLMSRSARYFYDADAVRTASDRENWTPSGWATAPNFHGDAPNEPRQPTGGKPNKQRGHGGANLRNVLTIPDEKERGHERVHEGFRDRWDGMSKAEQQAGGSAMRNVLKVATHSFKGAHFATFPPKLVEPCIKAGTSEAGCCAQCGAGWVRVVKKADGKGAWLDHARDAEVGASRNSIPGGADHYRDYQPPTTLGFRPACQCDIDEAAVPCTVLDPFAGSGTTGLVASRLGRAAVLVEISGDYARMARKRIEDDCPMFAGVTLELEARPNPCATVGRVAPWKPTHPTETP